MSYPIATIGGLGDVERPCCAPCAGAGGSAQLGELRPESEALRLVSGGVLPTIVWPSDVEAYKRKLDPDMIATDAAATACAALPSGVASAWREFYASWRAVAAKPVPTFGSANAFDEVRDYEAKLAGWHGVLGSAGCALHSPKVEPPQGPDLSVFKWVAVAVGLVAVAYLASPLVMGARRVAR